NITGRPGSTCETMWSSTAESAPKDDTMARSPGSSSVAACRSTPIPSISSNMPLSARMPNSRSLSFLCNACGMDASASAVAIERLLEGGIAQTAISHNEGVLGALARGDVLVDQPLDRIGHRVGLETRPEDLADGGILRR